MKIAAGYRKTDVGIIPNDWDVIPLKGNVSITHGFAFSSEYFVNSGPFRLTTPGHFFEEGGFRDIGEKQKFYSGPAPDNYVLKPGDLIVAMTEQAEGLLGSAAFIPNEHGYLHNQRLGRVKMLSPRIDLQYLFWVFNSAYYRAKVRETAAGTKVQHTSPEKLLQIKIPLPPPSEQHRIATALNDADGLMSQQNRLISKKRDLKQAATQGLLTGRTRLPGFSGPWKEGPISSIAVPSVERNMTGDKLPVLTCSKHRGFMDSLTFFKNQVFSKDLSSYRIIRLNQIGYPANHVEEGSIGLQDLYNVAIVSPIYVVFTVSERVDSYFLHRLLKLDTYRHQFKIATTSSVDRRGSLRWPEFSQIAVRVPPTKDEQTAVAQVVRDMEAELASLERRREKTRAVKQAMMQELLTGKTRLV